MSDESLFAAMHRPMRGVITAEGEARVERGWMTQEPAAVAPFKPAACVGMLGRRCTCGQWHETPEDGPGLFGSAWFWLLGLCAVVAWTGLAIVLIDYFKRMP